MHCDFACSVRQLSYPSNKIYRDRFLAAMRAKNREKKAMFADHLDLTSLDRIRTFQEFDDRFPVPFQGFQNVEDC